MFGEVEGSRSAASAAFEWRLAARASGLARLPLHKHLMGRGLPSRASSPSADSRLYSTHLRVESALTR